MHLTSRLLLLPMVLMVPWSPPGIHAQAPKREASPSSPLRERHDEAPKKGPLPIPQAVTLAEVTGGDLPEAHAFFIKLPSTTALVLCTNFRKIDDVRVNGHRVQLGKLMRRPPIGAYPSCGAWVWEAALPAGVIPLVRPNVTLPRMETNSPYAKFVILTSRGPRRAKLSPDGGHSIVVPEQRVREHFSLEVPKSEDFASIKAGDPIVQVVSGVVVGGVIDPEYANSPFKCGGAFLTFPDPPEKLNAPLKQVWGLQVEAAPKLDDRFVQKILPVRALSLKLGEKLDDLKRRQSFLIGPAGFFGEEWAFWEQNPQTKEGGIITGVKCHGFLTSEEASLLTTWLAQKFGNPIQLDLARDKTDLRAIWRHPGGFVTFCCGGNASSPNLTALLLISVEPVDLKDSNYEMHRYTEIATANRANFLRLMQAIIAEVKKAPPRDDESSLFRKGWMAGEAPP